MQQTPPPEKLVCAHCRRLGQQKYDAIYQGPFRLMDFNGPKNKKFIAVVSDNTLKITFKKLSCYKA